MRVVYVLGGRERIGATYRGLCRGTGFQEKWLPRDLIVWPQGGRKEPGVSLCKNLEMEIFSGSGQQGSYPSGALLVNSCFPGTFNKWLRK